MIKHRWLRFVASLFAITLVAAACSSDDGESSSPTTDPDEVEFDNAAGGKLLEEIRDRGELICGVNNNLPGFGTIDESGDHVGFDIDLCKGVAAAIFGESDGKVKYVDLSSEQRFQALQNGEIDILIRNTTLTATRDGAESVRFGPTMFYDGQGFMVPASSDIQTVEDLEGANICVLSGTTTELNLTSFLDSKDISFSPKVYEQDEDLQPDYEAGVCEAWTTDKSGLTGFKFAIEDAGGEEQRILEETISKEPLGPGVLDGEVGLAQIMDWTMWALIQAEEWGITSENVGSFETTDPNILNFLGKIQDPDTKEIREATSDDFNPGLNLDIKWAVNLITDVGNYGEIYSRHLDEIGLSDRGVNSLWTDGGLLYSPPYR